MSKKVISFKIPGFSLIVGTLTAMIGYTIHNSVFWAIMDWIFWPLALVKWLIFQEINMSIIKETFSFFLK